MSENTERSEELETLDENNGQTDNTESYFNDVYEAVRTGKVPPAATEPVKKEDSVETTTEEEEEEKSTQSATEDTSGEEDDWIDKIPDELKERVNNLLTEREALSNNFKALHNRLAPTQRQLAEAQRRLREREQLDKAPTTQPAPQNDSSEKKDEQDEVWEKIRESDPVLAEALDKRLAKQLQNERDALRKEFQDSIAPLQQKNSSEEFSRELDHLLSVVPNAPEVLQSPQYIGWLEAQSPQVQALNASPKAQDCIKILQLYSWDAQQIYGQSQPKQQETREDTTEADKIAQQRSERLRNPVPTPGTKPTAPKAKPLDTPESLEKLFNETLQKELEKQKQYGIR